MRRALRILALLAAAAVVLAVAAGGAAVALLHTERGQAVVRRELAAALGTALEARVSLGGVRGSVVRTLVVDDLTLDFRRGTALSVAHARVRWRPLALLAGRLQLDQVVADGVRMRATRTAEGWGLPDGTEEPAPDQGGTGLTVALDDVRIRAGRLAVALRDTEPPRRVALDDLALDASVRVAPEATEVTVRRLTAIPRGAAVTPLEASLAVAIADDGVVDVDDLRLATRRSRIAAQVHVEPGRRLVGRIALAPLDDRELDALLPGTGLATPVRARAAAAGPWDALGLTADADLGRGGRLALRGGLDLADPRLGWRARLRLDAVDPGAVAAGLPRASLHGTAGASGHGTDLRATATYRLALADSQLEAREIRRVRLAGRMTGGHHDVRARAVLPAASIGLRGRGVVEPVPAWRARGRLAVDDLATLVPETPGRVRGSLEASGRGTAPGARHADLRLALRDSSVRGVEIADGRVEAHLRGEEVRVADLHLRGPLLTLEGTGRAHLGTQALDARLAARTDLSAVRPPPAGGLAGRAALEATLGGRIDALAATARLDVRALAVGTRTAEGARLTLSAQRLGAAGGTASGRLEADAVRIAGGAPWTGGADLAWERRAEADTLRVSGRATAEGGGLLDAAAVATRQPRETAIRLDRLALALPDFTRWDLAGPARAVIAPDGMVDLPQLALVAGRQRVLLRGRVGPRGPADATLTLDDLALEPLCRLAGTVACRGRASGELRLDGTASTPRARAEVHVPGLEIEARRYGELVVRADYAERRLAVRADLDYPEAGVLDLDGTIPVDLAWDGTAADLSRAPLALRLRAQRLDVRIVAALAPTVVREIDGRLTADLRLEGPPGALVPSGTVDATARRLVLAATGVPWEDVVARLRADAAGVDVEALRLRAGDGSLQGDGRIGVRGGRPDALALRIALNDFLAVKQPAYEAALDGQLAVDGTVTAPRVTGTLEVDRAVVRPAMLPSSSPALEPDPTIEVVGLPPEPPAENAPSVDVAEALALGIGVRIERNAWIRRSDAQIELRGDLRVDKAPHQPVRIEGTVRLVRGWAAFQGRRFELDEGVIFFGGQSPPDPSFDITAKHRAGEYTVFIQVTGSASQPSLQLGSDPPLPQADVLSVLLFGKPAADLAGGESIDLQRQAVSLASGYVVPELQASVMEALGLDTFDLGTEAVRAGRYVTRDVFVSIAQEFGSTPGQSVAIEYSLTPRVSVKASTSTTGRSAIDLEWRRRY